MTESFYRYLPFSVITVIFYVFIFNQNLSRFSASGTDIQNVVHTLNVSLSSPKHVVNSQDAKENFHLQSAQVDSDSGMDTVKPETNHEKINQEKIINNKVLDSKINVGSNTDLLPDKLISEAGRALSKPEENSGKAQVEEQVSQYPQSDELFTENNNHDSNLEAKHYPGVVKDEQPDANIPSGANTVNKVLGFTEAVLASNNKPVYPKMAVRRNQQGTVVVSMWVDEVGKSSKLKVIKSSGYKMLDTAVLTFVEKERFFPAKQMGYAVASFQQFTFIFRLE